MHNQKNASIAAALGTAATFHVGANAAMKTLKESKVGQRMAADAMRAGYHHGKAGKQMGHGLRRTLTYAVGPETLTDYETGHAAGKLLARNPHALSRRTTREQYKHLDRTRRVIEGGKINVSPAQEKAMRRSALGTALEASKREAAGKESRTLRVLKNSVAKTDKPTRRQNIAHAAAGAAAAAGTAALAPHALVHPAINKVRMAAATSKPGKRWMQDVFVEGAAGKKMSKLREHATDLVVSPGALDTYRAGRAVNRLHRASQPKLVQGQSRRLKDTVKQGLSRLKRK